MRASLAINVVKLKKPLCKCMRYAAMNVNL